MIQVFEGAHWFLSNFYADPNAEVEYPANSFTYYPTAEHAFQTQKTLTADLRRAIMLARSPGDAKKLGRLVPLRPDWEVIKDDIMLDILRSKFSVQPLREKLLATGNQQLVEGNNWHDTYWGQCVCPRHHGRGRNQLGALLMQVREEVGG